MIGKVIFVPALGITAILSLGIGWFYGSHSQNFGRSGDSTQAGATAAVGKEKNLVQELEVFRKQSSILEESLAEARRELATARQQGESSLKLLRESEEARTRAEPSIDIPPDAHSYGQSMGSVMRKLYELQKKFPKVPDMQSKDYDEYVHRLDEVLMGMTPLSATRMDLKGNTAVAFQAASIEEALGLKNGAQSTALRGILSDFHSQMAAQGPAPERRTPQYGAWNRTRREANDRSISQINALLSPQEQEVFKAIFRRGLLEVGVSVSSRERMF